jgi:2-phospho-L-lactate/phosphoenolpyruvate guanylyltransferase
MLARVTSPAPEALSWGVVVPVKHRDVAKSRLAVLGDEGRRALALAFAEDVVRAAAACPLVARVLVVTDDAGAAAALGAVGADVVPDEPDAGLNPALAHGEALLRAGRRALGVAAVSADLPALRAADLAAVLARVRSRAVVADAAGSGTTVLAAAPGAALDPRYGVRSLERHLASGAALLDAPPAARRDVDTPGDLREALRLGVGPSTAAVCGALGLPDTSRPPGQGTMHA